MAFQGKQPFFAFLQGTAAGTTLEEAAPAENYILDERVPAAREDEFLAFNGFSSGPPFSRDSWFKHHKEYATAKVAKATVSATFDAINQPNWRHWPPDWDVVRIETIDGLCERAPTWTTEDTTTSEQVEAKVRELIHEMLAARESGTTMNSFHEAQLQDWLKKVNGGSDRRPAFVAPFAEVEDILKRPDWAHRLRDALGLGRVRPKAGKPTAIVLLQYNLVRVHNAHIGKLAWAASPTVLDDVPTEMPNPCFFPAPQSASADGYGFTVDLDIKEATFRREFLHGHITYTLDDFRRIGEVTADVSDAQIVEARRQHRDLLASDLRHLADLPARP